MSGLLGNTPICFRVESCEKSPEKALLFTVCKVIFPSVKFQISHASITLLLNAV